jgi:hypothetical protein
MTVTKASFRLLLVLVIVFIALGVWVHLMARASLPPEFQLYLRHQRPHPLMLYDKSCMVLLGIFVLVSAICLVGLFFFLPFSRPLFIVLVVGGVLLDPLLSLRVESGWSTLVDDCGGLLTVLIFFVIYFSPLKDSFVRKR